MNLACLPEHADAAVLALGIAEKQADHLAYTRRTLCAEPIDPEWVSSLEHREDLAEKVDAFVGRFGRLQDPLGEKLIPRFAALLGEPKRSLLDVLAYAERMGWIEDAEAFIGARKLGNRLVHEYLTDRGLFLDALRAADGAAAMLVAVVDRLARQASALGLGATGGLRTRE